LLSDELNNGNSFVKFMFAPDNAIKSLDNPRTEMKPDEITTCIIK
jgi:hypothetical protein